MKTTSGTLYNIKQLKFCPLECSELHIEVSQPENSCSLYKRGEIKVFNLDQFIRLVLLVSTCTCRRKLRQFFVTIAATLFRHCTNVLSHATRCKSCSVEKQ